MRPHLLPVPGPAVSGPLDNAGGRVVYWSFAETAGAVAKFRLWDSSSAAGVILATFSFVANQSVREFPGFHSLPYKTGLFLEVESGAIEGVVSVLPFTDNDTEQEGVPVFIIGSVELDINLPA